LSGCAGTRSKETSPGFGPGTVLEIVAVIDDAFLRRSASSHPTTGEGEPLLAEPVSIALPAQPGNGPMAIADRQTGRILQLTHTGDLVRDAVVSGSGRLAASGALRFVRLDLGANLYVCGAGAGHASTYDSYMRPASDLTPPYDALSLAEGTITGLALGAYGEIYLVDGINGRVYRFDASGRFLADFRGEESGWARLSRPAGAACAATDGSIYVCDPGQGHVVVFDNSGTPRRSFGESELSEPAAVALDHRGQAYVADTKARAIFVFDSSGRLVGRIDGSDLGVAEMEGPTDVAVADSLLYVADPPTGRVLEIRMHDAAH
jgi:DNA-binding beta-propeller fold protein YncE